MKYFIYCRKSQEAEDRQALSLESQIDEIKRLVADDPQVEIVDRFAEAFSAKAPGRKLFNQMIERLKAGEAEGIIAWHPDRLARNSMDGGAIIYLLDQGILKDLKFCNYTFENSSQGKFMLNIIFGYSKYYSDNLSENVKRGMRTKLKNGWRPGKAPVGYRNCADTQTINIEPREADAIRQLFNWCLNGETNVSSLHRRLRDELCFRTRQRKASGGRPLSRTQVYRALTNPFYAGWVVWNGETTKGAHEQLISNADFQKVQEQLNSKIKTRARLYDHTYRGLFRCGACGKAVTAERKIKPSGRTYVYYHCTRVHSACNQPSLEERNLTEQVEAFVETLKALKPRLERLDIKLRAPAIMQELQQSLRNRRATIASIDRQLTNLTDLRLRDCINDDEFRNKRRELQIERAKLAETASDLHDASDMFEPVAVLKKLCADPILYFRAASPAQKRELIRILSSNPIILDKETYFHGSQLRRSDNRNPKVCNRRGKCTVSRTKPEPVRYCSRTTVGEILGVRKHAKKPLDITWMRQQREKIDRLAALVNAVDQMKSR